jgi:hypothetical protein
MKNKAGINLLSKKGQSKLALLKIQYDIMVRIVTTKRKNPGK